jgi:mono/diheme cytochrome c family protein
MACHATGPVSIASGYGDLSGASTVRDPKGTNLLHLLASGSGHGGGSPDMPAFSGSYSDAERAALANYVLARWGGLAPTLTAQDASVARQP